MFDDRNVPSANADQFANSKFIELNGHQWSIVNSYVKLCEITGG